MKGNPKIPFYEWAEVGRLYQSGLGCYEVARRFSQYNANHSNVLKILRNLGIKRRWTCLTHWRKVELDPETKQGIIADYVRGVKVLDIAQQCEVGPGIIYRILKEAKVLLDGYPSPNRIGPRLKFTYEQEQEIISLYQEGETIEFIADKFACGPWYISDVLKANGIQIRLNNSYHISKTRITKMIALYEQGKSLSEVAKIFGYSRTCVGNYFKKVGVILRRKNILSEEQELDVLARSEKGERHKYICALYGISKSCLRRLLRQMRLRLETKK